MKKRNIIAFLLLCVVTMGIYLIYWLYKTRLALVEKNGQPQSIPPLSHIYLPLLGVVLGGIILFWVGDAEGGAVTAVGVIAAMIGITGFFVSIVMAIIFMYRFSLVSATILESHDGTSLFWLWMLGNLIFGVPLGPLLIQSHINQYLDSNGDLVNHNPLSQPPSAPTV